MPDAAATAPSGGADYADADGDAAGDAAQGRGGEASIEDFGSEAGGSERGRILAAFDGYLDAIAGRDYGAACAELSAAVKESLAQFVGGAKASACASTLPKLLAPSASQAAREQAGGEVTKVRVEGDRAFVVFKAPGAELYQLTMVEEDGEWKAATVAAAVLVPDL